MALWPPERYTRVVASPFARVNRYGPIPDLGYVDNQIAPYWRDADHSVLHVGNEAKETINDDKKFLIELDVEHFTPEQLKVELVGRDLTIEGFQEVKSENGCITKSFVHKWTLPEDCDLDAVHTELDDHGHLSVEVPKTGQHTKTRVVPIMPAKMNHSNM